MSSVFETQRLVNKSGDKRGIRHGLRHTRIYSIYHDMKKRCKSSNRKDASSYYLKGIRVCDEWNNNFISFYEWSISNGYSDDLSIDRIDSDGNYEPCNCRWVDKKTQARNTSIRKDNKSGYVGVILRKDNNKWSASIGIEGKTKKLGSYNTALDAAIARDDFIIKNNLEHKLNVRSRA